LYIIIINYLEHSLQKELLSFPTLRSSDLWVTSTWPVCCWPWPCFHGSTSGASAMIGRGRDECAQSASQAMISPASKAMAAPPSRSEEHTSELQSRENIVCRLLLEEKN